MKKLSITILAMLCVACAWAADKTSSPFTGISVEDAVGRQDIFLYNVESGYWLQDNRRNWSIYTTGAQLASQGMLLGVEAVGDGTYYIKSPLNNGKMGWNGKAFYMDMAAGVAWTFTTKAGVSNGYTIDNGTYYLHAAAEDSRYSGGAKVGYQLAWDNAGVRNTWQIVTREERENYLKASASKDNPIDATYLVGMANVPYNVSIQGTGWGINNWTITRDGGSQNLFNNNLWDMNAWTFNNVTSLNVSQTVTGAPNGKYRARFYLMYSPTQIGNATEDLYNDWAANGDQTVKVVAYAGGQETKATSYYSVDRATVQAAGEFYSNDYRLNKQLGTRFFAEDWNWISRRMYVGDFATDWIEFTVDNGTGTFELGFKTIDGLDATSNIEFGGVEVEYMGLESPFTGITPAEAVGRSDLFFYNVESGLWMQDNIRDWDFWTTHAQLDTHGMLMSLEADGESYKIKSPFNPTRTYNYLGSDLYLDNATPVSWTMTAKELASVGNAFTIENGGNYLNASAENRTNHRDYRSRTGNLLKWDSGTRNTWQIVTREEREAYIMANATEENPLDISYIVGIPNLTLTTVANGWTISRDGGSERTIACGNIGKPNIYAPLDQNIYEFNNVSSLNVSQTVEGALNGKYRARFYLMYSPTAVGDAAASHAADEVKAVGYAGGQEVPAASYYSQKKSTCDFWSNDFNLTKEIDGDYYIAGTGEANRRMYVGGFLTDWVEFSVSNGTFDLGIKTIDGLDAASWIVFGGVELEYMGPAEEMTVTLTNGFATFSADKAYEITTSGVSAYQAIEKQGNDIVLRPLTGIIPSHTGVLLYGEGQSSATLQETLTASSDNLSANMLHPHIEAGVVPAEVDGYRNYLLTKDESGTSCVFRPSSGKGVFAANRAYLALPIGSGAKDFSIVFEDDVTGITPINVNDNVNVNSAVYDLQGRKVADSYRSFKQHRGLYIVNGKKIVIK